MKKNAQLPSQYGYGGYDPSMDNPVSPIPQTRHLGELPDWLLPVGLAAGGLASYALLRQARGGIKKLIQRHKEEAKKHVDWNWDKEMLSRTGERHRSLLDPEKPLGHRWGPEAAEKGAVKQSSVRVDNFSRIIARLGNVARSQ